MLFLLDNLSPSVRPKVHSSWFGHDDDFDTLSVFDPLLHVRNRIARPAVFKHKPLLNHGASMRKLRKLLEETTQNINASIGKEVTQEEDKQWGLEVDVSGFKPEELTVSIDDDKYLTIEANKQKELKNDSQEKRTVLYFKRSIKLPENLKLDTMVSKLKTNGLLAITGEKEELKQIDEEKKPVDEEMPQEVDIPIDFKKEQKKQDAVKESANENESQ